MRIGAGNVFQSTSFINNKKPFAGAQLSGAELSKTSRTKEAKQNEEQKKPKTLLENLMDQKQRVTEQKYSLMGKTIENGGNVSDIKAQLETLDEQLKAIDTQIKSAVTEEKQKDEDKEINNDSKEPKTKEEAQAESLNAIVSNSNAIEQTEVIHSVKEQLEGEAQVLASQIATDSGKPGGALDSSKERLAEIEGKASALENDVKDRATKVNADIDEAGKEGEKSGATEKNPEIDVYA